MFHHIIHRASPSGHRTAEAAPVAHVVDGVRVCARGAQNAYRWYWDIIRSVGTSDIIRSVGTSDITLPISR